MTPSFLGELRAPHSSVTGIATALGAVACVLAITCAILSGPLVSRSSATSIHSDYSRLRTGDIVFLRGRSWRSRVVLLLEGRRAEFSHVGLVTIIRGRPFVIDAAPGPFYNRRTGSVALRPLEDFLSPVKVSEGAVYRLDPFLPQVAALAAKIARHYAAQSIPFDDQFDLSLQDRLYCTELVWASYRDAGLDLLASFPHAQHSVLLPSTLAHSRYLREVAQLAPAPRRAPILRIN